MSDIRQDVSKGAHHVLDLAAAVHAQRADAPNNTSLNLRALPARALTMAQYAAGPGTTLAAKREDAAHAAALLIAFIEIADLELASEAGLATAA